MTEANLENLSAATDGELSSEELRFLLRRLEHDVTLQQAWTCYHVVRDGLRRSLPPLASTGFAARVMLAIEHETIADGSGAHEVSVAAGKNRHWLRWSAGGAIAASVAMAALMMAQPGAHQADANVVASAHSKPAAALARVTPMAAPSMPAAAPPWLSGNSASMLSQPASATVGGLPDDALSPYARNLLPYQAHGYRTRTNPDGSYLLLINTDRAAGQSAPHRASATAQ